MQIDDQLKNRLVGVAVATILAVIFLPMLFDDPVDKNAPVITEVAIPTQPQDSPLLKTVVLAEKSSDVLNNQLSIESAPPAEAMTQNLTQASSQRTAKTKTTNPQKLNSVNHLNAPPTLSSSTRQKLNPSLNTTLTADNHRWFIQVASLADEAKANAFRDKLQAQGFMVTIESVWIKEKGHLFRLKVGPELDQQRAESMKNMINQLNHVDSMLVAQ
jgi:DedD protein